MEFEQQLKNAISPQDLDQTIKYNERYLHCAGDIDCLADLLIDDVLGLIGDPVSATSSRPGWIASVPPFGIMSQAVTAATFGDHRTEKKLKKLLKIV